MARYEKTVAGNDFVFTITIPTSGFTPIFNLLTSQQQQMILPSTQEYNLVDGYVVSYAGPWQASRTHVGAGVETVLTNEKYLNPVEGWPLDVTAMASVPTIATIRIFVS